MKYRIVSIIGNNRTVMAEVYSLKWAETFAEDVREWIRKNGGNGITKIVIEKI